MIYNSDNIILETESDDSTIQEEARINDSSIRVGDYNSVLWN